MTSPAPEASSVPVPEIVPVPVVVVSALPDMVRVPLIASAVAPIELPAVTLKVASI